MPGPMSCPQGEGRSLGEGAEHSHWASIILSVAVSHMRRPGFGRRLCVGGWLDLAAGPRIFLPGPVTGSSDAEMQRDAARALQCRAPPQQSYVLRRLEPGDVRGVQQPELPRAQLRARPDRGGRDQTGDRLRDGPEPVEGSGPGAIAAAPGPQEPESGR